MSEPLRRGLDVPERFDGVVVPPRWHVVPPGREADVTPPRIALVIEPGAGFGTGLHPTTQLCLQALSAFAPRDASAWRMLDFGAGSGILSFAAAKLGALVDAVEIDRAALDNARANARLNGVAARVRCFESLASARGPYELIVANILCEVLAAHATELTSRLASGGTLVLSGLVSTDLPRLTSCYASLLGGARPDIVRRDAWCALVWRGMPRAS